MTKEYALKQLKGLPLDMRDAAKKGYRPQSV